MDIKQAAIDQKVSNAQKDINVIYFSESAAGKEINWRKRVLQQRHLIMFILPLILGTIMIGCSVDINVISTDAQIPTATQEGNISNITAENQVLTKATEIKPLPTLPSLTLSPTSPFDPVALSSAPAISAQNASQVIQLDLLGKGNHNGMVISSDNRLLVAASSFGIYFYDANTLQPAEPKFIPTSSMVSSVAVSPKMDVIAAGMEDANIQFYNMKGELLKKLSVPGNSIKVVFSHNGTLLASGSEDMSVRLWEMPEGKFISKLDGHLGRINDLAFSPDDTILASSSDDKTAILWDVNSGKQIFPPLKGHTDKVINVTFSPDGKILATSSVDKKVLLWRVENGQQIRSLENYAGVTAVSFSPDGKKIATGTLDAKIYIWQVETGEKLNTIPDHLARIRSNLIFVQGGDILISEAEDGTIRKWRIKDGKQVGMISNEFTGFIRSVVISPDSSTLVFGTRRGTLSIWDLKSGTEIQTLEAHQDTINTMSFSRESNLLVTGSDDHYVKIWKMPEGQLISSLPNERIISAVAVTDDGKYLAAGGSDGYIVIWSLTEGKTITQFQAHNTQIWKVAFSPDEQTLASGSVFYDNNNGSVNLWSTRDWKLIQNLDLSEMRGARALDFSPDGRFLVVGGEDGGLRLFRTSDGSDLQISFSGHAGNIWGVAYSPDGRIIASGAFDKTVRLWNSTTGELLNTLKGHTSQVSNLAFSPNGKFIATSSWDGTVILWGINP